MNNSYTDENGGRKEVSGTAESRWHISPDVRNALALFVAALTLLAAVWGVCESTVARLYERFDQQDARFDQIDARFDQQNARFEQQNERFDQVDARFEQQDKELVRIESAMAEGFRQATGRIDRLEAKVDRIEMILIDYILRIGVQGDESAPEPAAQPAGLGNSASQTLPAKPVVPERGLGH